MKIQFDPNLEHQQKILTKIKEEHEANDFKGL